MGCLEFQSLKGIWGNCCQEQRSKRQCIHGYSFQSLKGILELPAVWKLALLTPVTDYIVKVTIVIIPNRG